MRTFLTFETGLFAQAWQTVQQQGHQSLQPDHPPWISLSRKSARRSREPEREGTQILQRVVLRHSEPFDRVISTSSRRQAQETFAELEDWLGKSEREVGKTLLCKHQSSTSGPWTCRNLRSHIFSTDVLAIWLDGPAPDLPPASKRSLRSAVAERVKALNDREPQPVLPHQPTLRQLSFGGKRLPTSTLTKSTKPTVPTIFALHPRRFVRRTSNATPARPEISLLRSPSSPLDPVIPAPRPKSPFSLPPWLHSEMDKPLDNASCLPREREQLLDIDREHDKDMNKMMVSGSAGLNQAGLLPERTGQLISPLRSQAVVEGTSSRSKEADLGRYDLRPEEGMMRLDGDIQAREDNFKNMTGTQSFNRLRNASPSEEPSHITDVVRAEKTGVEKGRLQDRAIPRPSEATSRDISRSIYSSRVGRDPMGKNSVLSNRTKNPADMLPGHRSNVLDAERNRLSQYPDHDALLDVVRAEQDPVHTYSEHSRARYKNFLNTRTRRADAQHNSRASPASKLIGTSSNCVRHGHRPQRVPSWFPEATKDMVEKSISGAYIPTGLKLRGQLDRTSPWAYIGTSLTKTEGTTTSPEPCVDCLAEQDIKMKEDEEAARIYETSSRRPSSAKVPHPPGYTRSGASLFGIQRVPAENAPYNTHPTVETHVVPFPSSAETGPDSTKQSLLQDAPSNAALLVTPTEADLTPTKMPTSVYLTTPEFPEPEFPDPSASHLSPHKVGIVIAKDLGDMLDAIVIEHSGVLDGVITNLRNGAPTEQRMQALSKDLERVSKSVTFAPAAADSRSPTRPVKDEQHSVYLGATSPEFLRTRVQSMPDLMSIIDSAADDLGLDLGKRSGQRTPADDFSIQPSEGNSSDNAVRLLLHRKPTTNPAANKGESGSAPARNIKQLQSQGEYSATADKELSVNKELPRLIQEKQNFRPPAENLGSKSSQRDHRQTATALSPMQRNEDHALGDIFQISTARTPTDEPAAIDIHQYNDQHSAAGRSSVQPSEVYSPDSTLHHFLPFSPNVHAAADDLQLESQQKLQREARDFQSKAGEHIISNNITLLVPDQEAGSDSSLVLIPESYRERSNSLFRVSESSTSDSADRPALPSGSTSVMVPVDLQDETQGQPLYDDKHSTCSPAVPKEVLQSLSLQEAPVTSQSLLDKAPEPSARLTQLSTSSPTTSAASTERQPTLPSTVLRSRDFSPPSTQTKLRYPMSRGSPESAEVSLQINVALKAPRQSGQQLRASLPSTPSRIPTRPSEIVQQERARLDKARTESQERLKGPARAERDERRGRLMRLRSPSRS